MPPPCFYVVLQLLGFPHIVQLITRITGVPSSYIVIIDAAAIGTKCSHFSSILRDDAIGDIKSTVVGYTAP